MAEGETKTERKQIEMSIWFVVLLIAVIVFMCVFMSMKSKLDTANAKLAEQETLINSLNKKNEDRTALVLELRKKATDGDLSMKALISKLDEMGFDYNAEPVQTEPEVSGEVVALSGEVSE